MAEVLKKTSSFPDGRQHRKTTRKRDKVKSKNLTSRPFNNKVEKKQPI
jgi:hypothetical protein